MTPRDYKILVEFASNDRHHGVDDERLAVFRLLAAGARARAVFDEMSGGLPAMTGEPLRCWTALRDAVRALDGRPAFDMEVADKLRPASSDRKRAVVRVVNAIEDVADARHLNSEARLEASRAARDELIEALTALLETT